MGIWSYVLATAALLAMLGGAVGVGYKYGRLEAGNEALTGALGQANKVIGDLNTQLEDKDGSVEKAQADMVKVQDDLAAIRRASSSVGTQLRSALDASQMGTCLLDPPVRGMRADSAKATDAAVDAANRARDPG